MIKKLVSNRPDNFRGNSENNFKSYSTKNFKRDTKNNLKANSTIYINNNYIHSLNTANISSNAANLCAPPVPLYLAQALVNYRPCHSQRNKENILPGQIWSLKEPVEPRCHGEPGCPSEIKGHGEPENFSKTRYLLILSFLNDDLRHARGSIKNDDLGDAGGPVKKVDQNKVKLFRVIPLELNASNALAGDIFVLNRGHDFSPENIVVNTKSCTTISINKLNYYFGKLKNQALKEIESLMKHPKNSFHYYAFPVHEKIH
jgi:hypothetical protein